LYNTVTFCRSVTDAGLILILKVDQVDFSSSTHLASHREQCRVAATIIS